MYLKKILRLIFLLSILNSFNCSVTKRSLIDGSNIKAGADISELKFKLYSADLNDFVNPDDTQIVSNDNFLGRHVIIDTLKILKANQVIFVSFNFKYSGQLKDGEYRIYKSDTISKVDLLFINGLQKDSTSILKKELKNDRMTNGTQEQNRGKVPIKLKHDSNSTPYTSNEFILEYNSYARSKKDALDYIGDGSNSIDLKFKISADLFSKMVGKNCVLKFKIFYASGKIVSGSKLVLIKK